ncbi:hypothetical protein IT084_05715 [Desulfallas sp. Bu1-1]|jgi:hypothetical protein|uniref:hypothetical protein n=1 Tax=Desulfallas sp. Bu1-1 TaxID=2787620 RepID=UPI00189F8BF2|nr:hypothetical protein [Desulfallas sp. Bu1-1]MBF7082475.1 hypothetical protein [Desulfallas sp. Bu1-1]
MDPSPKNPTDLQAVIERTKKQIYNLKKQIAATVDPGEKRRLKRRLAQQQRLQLGYLGKLG